MIRRVLSFLSKASFWGVVLMLLGLAWAVVVLGFMLPNLVSTLAEGLVGGYPVQADGTVVAYQRMRQRIFGWTYHDDGWWFGYTGAKEDLPVILGTRANEDFDTCSDGHRGMAMVLMTNHSVKGGTRDDWKRWCDAHAHQTQAEWMMAGFKEVGIEFKLPPDHATEVQLLKWIGRDAREQEMQFKVDPPPAPPPSLPDYIVTNLQRVLHYHGFDATKITQEDIAADSNGEIRLGMTTVLKNHSFLRFMHNPFDDPQRPPSQAKLNGILNPLTPWIHWAISFTLFQAGFFLWLRARFKRQAATALTLASGS
jgi:hypothetical protein